MRPPSRSRGTSGLYLVHGCGHADRLQAALTANPRRWCRPAVAAAYALPPDFCATSDEWVALLDRLDASVRAAIHSHVQQRA